MASRFKIAFISHSTELLGAPRSLLILLEQLDRARYEPIAICPSDGPLVDKIAELGIPVFVVRRHKHNISLSSKLIAKFRYAFTLKRVLRRERPDFVYVNTIAHASPVLVSWLARCPVIVHVREGASYFEGYRRMIRALFVAYAAKRFITVSRSNRDILVSRGIPEGRIDVVYNGIDSTSIPKELYQKEGEEYRRRLGLRLDDTLIGTVGQINPRKGTLYFIEAASHIMRKASAEGMKFVVVGGPTDKEYFDRVRRACTTSGMDDIVLFEGPQDDVMKYYSAMDIFVNPTLEEPFARVNLEAMLMGKPIVATNVGGNPEAIVNGKTGFLVPPGDSKAMADKIMCLAENKEWREQFGRAANKRVRERFAAKDYCGHVERIFDDFISAEHILPRGAQSLPDQASSAAEALRKQPRCS